MSKKEYSIGDKVIANNCWENEYETMLENKISIIKNITYLEDGTILEYEMEDEEVYDDTYVISLEETIDRLEYLQILITQRLKELKKELK
jgi:hypothetical protein